MEAQRKNRGRERGKKGRRKGGAMSSQHSRLLMVCGSQNSSQGSAHPSSVEPKRMTSRKCAQCNRCIAMATCGESQLGTVGNSAMINILLTIQSIQGHCTN